MLDTYANLKTSIANFAHRGDLTSIIPDLITLAENRINGDLDARFQDTVTSLVTVASTQTVATPTGMMNIRAITVTSTTPTQTLLYQTPESFQIAHQYAQTGTPFNYTVIGSSIYLAPIPDAVYTLTTSYKAKIVALSDTVTTSSLLTNYPKVYLCAAMCEVAAYCQNKTMAQHWEPQYKDAIDSVNNQDWYSGGGMRVKTDVRV